MEKHAAKDALLFQVTLALMGVATFSFSFASLYYYGSSLGSRIDDDERALYSRRGDRFWLLGYTLLFLDHDAEDRRAQRVLQAE